jgi:ribosome biogenesis GTPase
LAPCRFTDCSHVHEPDCAVRAAVADGRVAASRYESYRRILGMSS